MKDQESIKTEFIPNSKKLYIIFGGVAAGIGMPPFEFAKASNILSETRVFVRDLRQSWYQCGLTGISRNVTETKEYLEGLIEENTPEEVIMIGNSMGGFAAIMFSALIGNSRAVAFAPQTFICPFKKFSYRDPRWISKMFKTYLKTWSKGKIWDLRNLIPEENWRADIYVSRADRLDHLHANHLTNLENVTIHEYDTGGHALVKELRDKGELVKILQG